MKFFGIQLGFKNSGFKRGIDESRGEVKKFKKEVDIGHAAVEKFGKKIQGLFAGAAIGGFFKGIVERADQLQDISDRFGISAESLQKVGNVAEQNGSSLEGVAGAMSKLDIATQKALRGDKETITAFERLGVSLDDLKSMAPDEIMAKIGESSMNSADMVKVMGKSATELRTTLAQLGDADVEVMSNEQVQKLSDAKDKCVEIYRTMQGWGAELAGGVADGAQGFQDFLTTFVAAASGGPISEFFDRWEEFKKQQIEEREAGKAEAEEKKKRDTAERQRMNDQARFDQAEKATNKGVDDLKKTKAEAYDDLYTSTLASVRDEYQDEAGMTGAQIADKRRAKSAGLRNRARAERKFARLHGDNALDDLHKADSPAAKIEKAFQKGLDKLQEKVEDLYDPIANIDETLEDFAEPSTGGGEE